MHYITIAKTNGEIVDYRSDNSVPAYWTLESLKSAVSKDRGLNEGSIETLAFENFPETDVDFTGPLNLFQHKYDKQANKLKNNPDYVAAPIERRWSLSEVTSKLTLSEKTKFINNLTPTVVTAKDEFKSPRNKNDTTEILQFLVDSGDISSSSMQSILA